MTPFVADENGHRGEAVLGLPVHTSGVELGHATDLVVDLDAVRAIGVDVLCEDRRRRFLPLAAATIEHDRITVASPLVLLDELGASFYRERTDGLREIRGRGVERDRLPVGHLADVEIAENGAIEAFLVDGQEGELRIPAADGAVIAPL